MSGLRTIARFLLMRHHRSKTPTGILPLSELHSAVIMCDPKDPCPEKDIKRFFEPYGISYSIISEFDKDIRTGSDIFISLTGETSISERYAAMSSTARFKVGRRQIKRDVYDLVVYNPAPESFNGETLAFCAICEMLKKIS